MPFRSRARRERRRRTTDAPLELTDDEGRALRVKVRLTHGRHSRLIRFLGLLRGRAVGAWATPVSRG